jgi:2-polyprenyl-6-methoxyphenol hydroxylase-like FAD-dependent oxidoreductase
MSDKNVPEVLVVGAGPVGLFAALSLARQGVSVRIVDRDWRTGAHSYALAIHRRSLALLDELGLREKVLQGAYPIHSVGLYDRAGRRAEIGLSTGEAGDLGLATIRQDVLEQILEQALQQSGVRVQWNHEVSGLAVEDDGVLATVDKLEKDSVGYAAAHTEWVVARSTRLKVPYVIGADGHQSTVRRSLGIDYPRVGPPRHFAVFEFQTDAVFHHQMRIAWDDAASSVLWPLPEGYCRWGFELADFAARTGPRIKDRLAVELGGQAFPVLAEENLAKLIAERAPWFDGRIGEIRWRIVVRFDSCLASALGRQRAWLAGDAVHMTGPVGMQSMNLGFREAHELTATIAGLLRKDRLVAPLDSYNRRWLSVWRSLLGLAGGLSAGERTDPWVRRYSDRLLPCIPASFEEIPELLGPLDLHLPVQEVVGG